MKQNWKPIVAAFAIASIVSSEKSKHSANAGRNVAKDEPDKGCR